MPHIVSYEIVSRASRSAYYGFQLFWDVCGLGWSGAMCRCYGYRRSTTRGEGLRQLRLEFMLHPLRLWRRYRAARRRWAGRRAGRLHRVSLFPRPELSSSNSWECC